MFLNQAALLLGHVPLPGPVLGLVALLGALAVRGSVPAALERAATPLIGLMPLFFIPGTVQYERGVGTPRFWLFFPNVVALSVLITWVYVESQRSILAAILTHLASNLTTTVCTPMPPAMEERRAALLSLAALLLAGTSGPPPRVDG